MVNGMSARVAQPAELQYILQAVVEAIFYFEHLQLLAGLPVPLKENTHTLTKLQRLKLICRSGTERSYLREIMISV